MKSILLTLIVSLSFAGSLKAQITQNDSVEVIPEFKNMWRYQNFYLSAQPSYEAMQWLAKKGVVSVINLRSDKENSEFASASYNEDSVTKHLELNYFKIPVDGIKDYTPEKLQELSALIGGNEPILIHCAGAGRVTYFFMAYLVKSRGYSMDEAIHIGKKLTFSLPLENLLDAKIRMELGE